ncbi:MAG TPA: HD domain-containing protein [Actinomycetota bacterium]|nr:HD domain-containing protein [Actinomycetota bacterium]
MERSAALEIVGRYTTKGITYRHLISVEGVMRALARHFSEDPHRWGLAGLFHDLDYDITQDDIERHTDLTVEWLKAEGFDDEEVLNAIVGHLRPTHRTDLMSKAIVHADALAGLLVACALVRPEKATGMKVSSVKKKLKERSFAPGVEREEIHDVEGSIGIPLDDFIAIGIQGIQEVAGEIELSPSS